MNRILKFGKHLNLKIKNNWIEDLLLGKHTGRPKLNFNNNKKNACIFQCRLT